MVAYGGGARRRKKLLRKGLRRPNQITMNSRIMKSNPFHIDIEARLRAHSQCHLDSNNPPMMVQRHEGVMREFMKRGASFEMSHREAQKKYQMMGRCV